MRYICNLVDGRCLYFEHRTAISFRKMTIKFTEVSPDKATKHHIKKLYQTKTGKMFFIFCNRRFHFSDFYENFA